MYNTDGIAVMLLIIIVIMLAAFVFAMGYGITYAITTIWKETLADDTFEVTVVDKSMEDNYVILVKGVNLDGEEYCDKFIVDANRYASVTVGDTVVVRETKTTQPIFGEQVFYSLEEFASCTP